MRKSVVLIAMTFLLFGCAHTPELQRYEYVELVMASPARLVLYAADESTARDAARATYDKMHDVDRALSDWNANSELRQLELAAPDARGASQILRNALLQASEYAQTTDGAFDPTLGPIVALWRESRTSGQLPSPERIAAARRLVGVEFIEWTPETIRIKKSGVAIDLGAIGKGIALDEASDVLQEHQIDRHMIDFDGEIQVGKAPPQRSSWTIEIQSYGGTSTLKLELVERSVSTSGDLHQFIEIDGVRYSHIVDPESGLGLRTAIQVTVIAHNGAAADALATAGCVLGPKRFQELLTRSYPDVGAVVTTIEDGKTAITRIGNLPVLSPDAP